MSEEFDSLVSAVLGNEPPVEEESGEHSFEEVCRKFSEDVKRHLVGMGEVRLEQLQNDSEQRFSTSMPLDRVHDTTIALVGAGGLGNWIWRVLLGMGFRRIHVFDDDTVGVENIGPQAHRVIDLDLPKVEAVRREAMAFRGIEIGVHNMKVNSFGEIVEAMGCVPNVLIGATDSAEFRNAIINGFAEDRRLELFIDLRMSLGDWNAFAFTPKALDEFGDFADKKSVYSTYKEMAVFEPSEAVMEPCTARAITYTGANVASYVGAFLHWWMNVGRDRCHRDRQFLKDEFYCENRRDRHFNWLYRYSSKDFLPETMTELQAVATRQAANCTMLQFSMENAMEKLWKGLFLRKVGEDQYPYAAYSATEAYMDISGGSHVYQQIVLNPLQCDVPTNDPVEVQVNLRVVVAIDLNLTAGSACVAAAPYLVENGIASGEVERRLAKMVSPNRVMASHLTTTHLFFTLLNGANYRKEITRAAIRLIAEDRTQDGRLKEILSAFCPDGPNDHEPLTASLFVRRSLEPSDEDEMITIALDGRGFDEERRVWRYVLGAWKIAESHIMQISPASVPYELGEMHGDSNFATGWVRSIPGKRPTFYMCTGNGLHSPIDLSYEWDLVQGAIHGYVEEGTQSDVVCTQVKNVPDGTKVAVACTPGVTYVKGTEGTLMYLFDGSRKLYVHPDMVVFPVDRE